MSRPSQPSTPESRDRAQARVRTMTRAAVFAATGIAAFMGVVVAREHPGSSSPATTTSRLRIGHVHGHDDAVGLVGLVRYDHDTFQHVVGFLLLLLLLSTDEQLVCADGDVRGDVDTVTATTDLRRVLTVRSFRAIGTTATVVVQDPRDADPAELMLAAELDADGPGLQPVPPDSELAAAARAGRGAPCGSAPLLFEALDVACGGTSHGRRRRPHGRQRHRRARVRPRPRRGAGRAARPPQVLGPVAGYSHVQLDPAARTVRIPRGRPTRPRLDGQGPRRRPRRRPHRPTQSDGGALVSLGGDVAVAGPPPPGGWAVGIAHESSTPAAERRPGGGHHARRPGQLRPAVRDVDAGGREGPPHRRPATGDCAEPYWRSSPPPVPAASTPTSSPPPPSSGASRGARPHSPPSVSPSASCAPTARSFASTAGPPRSRRELHCALVRDPGHRPHGARSCSPSPWCWV